ncbi:MAG TPA: OFA family MFS transporter [Steroidobacteraceae bacterium]|nr:OFA family MFS transporter [Steroidobacteraceae bacterium]
MSATSVISPPGFLTKERTIAGAGFNRWLVPPAALAIHLCIGMAYGFSVFWLPLSKAIGITSSVACPKDMGVIDQILTTTCDWKISMLGWTYTLFFVVLGSAAALWGGWLERVGPRKAGMVAAVCWCGGLVIAAGGVLMHQIWIIWLGSGVIGGIGLGLGYISPVSTLVKWFPDRRGMATGMAIMGFGGGAMIGAPLADRLMKLFATPTDVGVWQTFLVLAAIYFVFMTGGALGYRVPPADWKPAGWTPPRKRVLVSEGQVHMNVALATPQFWLVWGVLMLNVTAGIGILGMASPLLQEVFGGRLIGVKASFDQLSPDQLKQIATIAAGFTGLLSLFNIAGRIFWASLSDKIGRQATYMVFFLIGLTLYASIPWTASQGNLALFVAFFCVNLSMYGGGFATVPAYLADLFGEKMVGAIHGRLLTAWSTAGILGPVLVNYIREYQLDHGVAKAQAYSVTMYILAGLLAIGFICNLLIRPVPASKYMTAAQIAELDRTSASKAASVAVTATGSAMAVPAWMVAAAWIPILVPLAWGIWITLQKAAAIFSQG